MGRLDGKVAFVSGAARGQGRSHALRLAEEGADIIAVDICSQVETALYPMPGPEDLHETVRLVEALDRRVYSSIADVRDLSALSAAVSEGVTQLGGRLDIVCGNAGIIGAAPTVEMTEESWRDMIDINLTGVWNTVKAALPHMLAARNGGSIVLTSSAAGKRARLNIGHYVAAKHGVVGLMKTLALELAPDNIRVNCIMPTQVDTDMIQNDLTYRLFNPSDPTKESFAPISQSMNALSIPWVDPIDISNAVAFLCSEDARYITGVSLPVDAGALIK